MLVATTHRSTLLEYSQNVPRRIFKPGDVRAMLCGNAARDAFGISLYSLVALKPDASLRQLIHGFIDIINVKVQDGK